MAKRLSKQSDGLDSQEVGDDLSLETKQEIIENTIEDISLLRDVYMAAKEADIKEAARQRKVEQAMHELKKAGRLGLLDEVMTIDKELRSFDHIRRAIATLDVDPPNGNEPVNTTASFPVEEFSHSPPPPSSLSTPTTGHSQLIIMTEPSVPMAASSGPEETIKSKKPKKKGKKKAPKKEVTPLDAEPHETPAHSSVPSSPKLQAKNTVAESGEDASEAHLMSNLPSTNPKKKKKRRANKKKKKAINPAAESEGARPQYSAPKSSVSPPKGTHERTISDPFPTRRRSPSLTQVSFDDEPSYDTPTIRVPTKTFSFGSWSAPVSERGASPDLARE